MFYYADTEIIHGPVYSRKILSMDFPLIRESKQLNKEEVWVVSKPSGDFKPMDVKNVLLTTLDKNDNMKAFLYRQAKVIQSFNSNYKWEPPAVIIKTKAIYDTAPR